MAASTHYDLSRSVKAVVESGAHKEHSQPDEVSKYVEKSKETDRDPSGNGWTVSSS